MTDGVKESIDLGWNIIYGVLGAVVGAISLALKFGGQLKNFATKDELKAYVTNERFTEYKGDVKDDFAIIRQDIAEMRSEVIEEIRRGRQ